jgi:hypothetical protein
MRSATIQLNDDQIAALKAVYAGGNPGQTGISALVELAGIILASLPDDKATTGDAGLDQVLRGLSVESVVRADLARLQTDPAHRASVRELLCQRIYEVHNRYGYPSRPWLKALEVLESLDTTHPLAFHGDDGAVALHAQDRLEHIRYNASVDPQSWWHSEELWRKFCADRQWVPEDHL